jgi:hypothetical protein
MARRGREGPRRGVDGPARGVRFWGRGGPRLAARGSAFGGSSQKGAEQSTAAVRARAARRRRNPSRPPDCCRTNGCGSPARSLQRLPEPPPSRAIVGEIGRYVRKTLGGSASGSTTDRVMFYGGISMAGRPLSIAMWTPARHRGPPLSDLATTSYRSPLQTRQGL